MYGEKKWQNLNVNTFRLAETILEPNVDTVARRSVKAAEKNREVQRSASWTADGADRTSGSLTAGKDPYSMFHHHASRNEERRRRRRRKQKKKRLQWDFTTVKQLENRSFQTHPGKAAHSQWQHSKNCCTKLETNIRSTESIKQTKQSQGYMTNIRCSKTEPWGTPLLIVNTFLDFSLNKLKSLNFFSPFFPLEVLLNWKLLLFLSLVHPSWMLISMTPRKKSLWPPRTHTRTELDRRARESGVSFLAGQRASGKDGMTSWCHRRVPGADGSQRRPRSAELTLQKQEEEGSSFF